MFDSRSHSIYGRVADFLSIIDILYGIFEKLHSR